jgi:hypothetical protein
MTEEQLAEREKRLSAIANREGVAAFKQHQEWIAERELRLKAQNKQKDVHLYGQKPLTISPEKKAALFGQVNKDFDEHLAVDKPKQFTKNEKAKLKTRGIKPVIRIPTEHEEQCAVIALADQHPIAKHLFAIPNGANKSPATAAKFKREGLRAGYPDLGLDVARRGYHGLRIEMKRSKGGVVSENQSHWFAFLTDQGYCCKLCRGAEEAIEVLEWYLTTENI